MKTPGLALGIAIAATSAMAHAATHEHDLSQHPVSMQAAADSKKYEASGVLRAVNAKARKVQIAHEAIADLGWPPMTMWFGLRDPLPGNIQVGDALRFELLQTATKQWVIARIARK